MLRRTPSTDQGTFGEVLFPDGTKYYSVELPWKDNARGKSCIPAGRYLCTFIESPSHGPTYELVDVPGRTHIQIHSANYAGDASLGFRSDLLGCIALGSALGILNGQLVVLNSIKTVEAFEQKLGREDFFLIIEKA